MAGYSSRGPTAIDFQAKPDLVAPGTGVVSLSSASSTMCYSKPKSLLSGSSSAELRAVSEPDGHQHGGAGRERNRRADAAGEPVADAEPGEGDPAVHRADLSSYNVLTQGAGFLNAQGAVQLARFFRTAQAGLALDDSELSGDRRVIWGNHRLSGGVIRPNANAYQLGTTWGLASTATATTSCGARCSRRQHRVGDRRPAERRQPGVGTVRDPAGDNLVWGTYRDADNLVWGTIFGDDNIVWGTDCGGRGIATTSSGAPRSQPTTWCGARRWPATAWCGARRAPATTWCGARARGRHRQSGVGHAREGDNLGGTTNRQPARGATT